jgi:putative phosphoribosyl transferase
MPTQAKAAALLEAGLATLLIDLLTPAEEAEDLRTARLQFDVWLRAGRRSPV